MVFGWGKKKTETKTENVASLRDISFSDVKPIIKDLKESRTKILISEAKAFREKIKPQIEEIRNLTRDLEKDDLKVDDIDKHLKILVVRGKQQVVSIIKKESSLKLTDVKSVDDVMTLEKEISQLLKRVGDVLGRQSRVIHIFAKKYADKLKANLSSLNSDKDQIHILLQNQEKFDKKTSEIIDEISHIDYLKKQNSENLEKIKNFSNKIEKGKEKIQTISKEIDELKSSEEYKSYLEIKNKIASLTEEQNEIEKEIDLNFTKISRPLTKYQYVTSIDKEQKILLEKLTNQPFQVLTPQNKDDVISILYSVRKGVESGLVSVKDQTKSITHIDEIISSIDTLITKISDFNQKKETLRKELKIFNIEKLRQKEDDLSKCKKDNEDLESRIHDLQKENEESDQRIPNSIKTIESLLHSASSIRYTITGGY